ncbi:MAG: hypothetical protein A2076_16815 [Geobacteraceae bacterium GWC2_53_11]|nr:MAG: hypothetical protein A2076_16815 [Geobacteraceae bacterium GWC2_53_11]
MKVKFIIYAVLACGLFGCGSTDNTLLNTTTASVTVDKLDMESDIVSWVDAKSAKATACVATSYKAIPPADSVNVTAAFTPYANSDGNNLAVRIEKATIIYTPANAVSPALATEYQYVNQVVQAGKSLPISIRVATQEQKQAFVPILACDVSSAIYKYYVTIILDVTEIGGKTSNISTGMTLRFSDYVDK